MKIFGLIFTVFFALNGAAYVVPTYRDIKPATQQMIEKQKITAPIALSTTHLKTAQATSASVTTTITTFSAQPDVARNITITTGGVAADCNAGTPLVTGTNIKGAVITEGIPTFENLATTSTGLKAFRTISSVVIPIQDGAGCTFSVGIENAFGLKNCLASAPHFIHAGVGGVSEATRNDYAVFTDDNEVEKNTFLSNDMPADGVKDIELFFMQNFVCR